ncbi:MerR family DNA-binding transcriptional regulator [Paenibacillus oceani]|nr:MerR family DNA-binding transcriptional regulator [Paenibacillus oceani]
MMRPIDIAEKLNLSTSALRNYEAKGLVPPALRSAGGHRMYTEEHLAYFECLQAMSPGFGMEVASEVVKHVQLRDASSARWCITVSQAQLHHDKQQAGRNLQMLEDQVRNGAEEANGVQERKTIGEVSAATLIAGSAIRYWEKEGLIASSRDPHNGYRIFGRSQLRKITLLGALRNAIYSPELVSLKQAISRLDLNDLEGAREIAGKSLAYLDRMSEEQFRGMFFFGKLCRLLSLMK